MKNCCSGRVALGLIVLLQSSLLLAGNFPSIDIAGDYVAGTEAGDPALFMSSGDGLWQYGSSSSLDGRGAVPLEWDPSFAGVGTYEVFDADHSNGTIDNFPFAIRVGSEIHGQPDLSEVVVFEWTSLSRTTETVAVRGYVRKVDVAGGDGVAFRLYSDEALLASGGVPFDDDVGVAFEAVTDVSNGSTIRLVVDDGTQTLFDTFALSLQIVPETIFTDGFEHTR